MLVHQVKHIHIQYRVVHEIKTICGSSCLGITVIRSDEIFYCLTVFLSWREMKTSLNGTLTHQDMHDFRNDFSPIQFLGSASPGRAAFQDTICCHMFSLLLVCHLVIHIQ